MIYILECKYCFALTESIGPCIACGKKKFKTVAVDPDVWRAATREQDEQAQLEAELDDEHIQTYEEFMAQLPNSYINYMENLIKPAAGDPQPKQECCCWVCESEKPASKQIAVRPGGYPVTLSLEPIDDAAGDLMTIAAFKAAVSSGSFTDYDGYGYYATDIAQSMIKVKPSDLKYNPATPFWATHVVWYNR